MRWNEARYEWEGETAAGAPIAVAGEAFMTAVAEVLASLYGPADSGYTVAQVREANEALHAPGAWELGMPGVRRLYED